MNLDTKDDLRLVDHLNKCRCCFEKFNYNENQIKITDIIKEQFLELTQIELKSSPSYSKSVCIKCTNELQSISNFRLDLITKQQELYNFVTTFEYKIQDAVKFEPVNIKIETQSSDELDNIFKFESQYEEIEKFEMPVSQADYQSTSKRYSLRKIKSIQPKVEIKVQKKALTKIKTKIKTKVKKVQPKEPEKRQVSKKVNCPQCGILIRSTYLNRHIRLVHLKEKRFFCDHCSYAVMKKDQLRKHMTKHLQEKMRAPIKKKIHPTAICPHCGIFLKQYNTLRRHIERVHLKMKHYFCDMCKYGSRDKIDIRTHVKIHIPTQFREKFYCDQCDTVSFTMQSLNTHKKVAHPIDGTKYECQCGKKFALFGQFNNHVRHSHGNYKETKNQICTICKKAYATQSLLKIHMANHTGIKNVACEVCGKTYVTLGQLRIHSMSHGDRRFVCEFEGCTKKFFTMTTFEGHKKTHLDQRDYACHLCDKKYFAGNHLKRHILHFHKQLKLSCELPGCSSKFARKETYRNHILSHHKDLSQEKIQSLFMKIREYKQV